MYYKNFLRPFPELSRKVYGLDGTSSVRSALSAFLSSQNG